MAESKQRHAPGAPRPDVKLPGVESAINPPDMPTHIRLGADWGEHREGRVLAATLNLISQLDLEGVRYAPATERERQIAGFADQPEA